MAECFWDKGHMASEAAEGERLGLSLHSHLKSMAPEGMPPKTQNLPPGLPPQHYQVEIPPS